MELQQVDPHLQWVPDGQQGVLGVLPLGLAGGAQVVVRTHRTLEAGPDDGTLAAVAGDVWVEGRGRGHVRRRTMRRRRTARRRAEGEGREGMKGEVPAVLLFLCKKKKNSTKLYSNTAGLCKQSSDKTNNVFTFDVEAEGGVLHKGQTHHQLIIGGERHQVSVFI